MKSLGFLMRQMPTFYLLRYPVNAGICTDTCERPSNGQMTVSHLMSLECHGCSVEGGQEDRRRAKGEAHLAGRTKPGRMSPCFWKADLKSEHVEWFSFVGAVDKS